MWIYLKHAFLSIIDPAGDYAGGGPKGDKLLVRARFKGDIERVFPRARVTETPQRDYRYRAMVSRETVAKVICAAVMSIDAKNFKGSVKERWRHDAYAGCWGIMENEQHRQHNPRRATKPKDFDDGELDWTPYRQRGFFDRT